MTVAQLRALCFEVDERLGARNAPELLSVSQTRGVIPRSSITDKEPRADDLSKYKVCEIGDIVLNRFNAYRGALGRVTIRGIVSPDYLVLRPTSRGDSGFLAYRLLATDFSHTMKASMGGLGASDPDSSGFSRIDVRALLRTPTSGLSASQQGQIADYLDAHTAKIDRLIGMQERLIETLAERRQAVISHAVTSGLDPNAPKKDSGIVAIGCIPAHWKALPLKRLISKIEQGVSPQASAELADENSWGVVKSGCVNRGVFADVQHKRLAEDFVFDPSIEIRKGDLLVSRASGSPALVGSAAIVRQLRYRLILSDKTFRLVAKASHDSDFLEKVMNSRLFRDQVLGAISGAEGLANNLPSSSLRQFAFPAPPTVEQAAIVQFLDHETSNIDALATKTREMIDVLKERRQALISAAVTGKIDVRGLS